MHLLTYPNKFILGAYGLNYTSPTKNFTLTLVDPSSPSNTSIFVDPDGSIHTTYFTFSNDYKYGFYLK